MCAVKKKKKTKKVCLSVCLSVNIFDFGLSHTRLGCGGKRASRRVRRTAFREELQDQGLEAVQLGLVRGDLHDELLARGVQVRLLVRHHVAHELVRQPGARDRELCSVADACTPV